MQQLVSFEAPVSPVSLTPFILDGATFRAFLGQLADNEAKNLVTRTYTITKEEANAVQNIADANSTPYISSSEFVRHAIWELCQAYIQVGFPDQYTSDVLAHVKLMRQNAEQLKLRQDFGEIMSVYESSLNLGAETGNPGFIDETLGSLEEDLERTPGTYWKAYLKRNILRNVIVKGAIDYLFEYARGHEDHEYQERAQKWQSWLEGMAE